MEVVDSLKKWLSLLWLRYEMVTCIFMFEPWEKFLINSAIFSCALILIVSSYVFLPNYLSNLLVMFGITSSTETGFQQFAATK